MTASAEAISRAFAGWSFSRPPLTHREFAKRRTKLPGGPLKGTAYDPGTDPVQSYFTDQLDIGQWESLTWTAPPQVAGKTQCAILVPALRAVIELRAAVGYGLPTLHDLDRGWQTKVAPTIKDAGLGDYLPDRGPGSKGGRPPSVQFEDPENNRAGLGSFVFLAGSAKQVTCQIIVIDELDAWRTADGEPRWDDIEDCWARADSFQSAAIRIGTGTVECDDPARSIVLSLVNERGTGTRMHHRCPHCFAFAPAEFAAFTYEYRTTDGGPDLGHASATAAYACPSCGVRWSEDDRRKALLGAVFAHKGQTVDAGGQIIGPAPATRHLGLRTTALDCILTTMGAIAEKWAAARFALEQHGTHEPMRKFCRYQQVACYTGDQQSDDEASRAYDAKSLERRSILTAWSPVVEDRNRDDMHSRHIAQMPAECTLCVSAIDVQEDRIYWSVIGMDESRRTYDVAWGYEYARADSDGRPLPYSPGDLLSILTRAADCIDDITGGIFRCGVVDVGNPKTEDETVQFLRSRAQYRAIMGTKTDDGGLPAARNDDRGRVEHRTTLLAWDYKWRSGLGAYVIRTNAAQQSVANAYSIAPGDPGAALLPGPMRSNEAYLQHLTGTTWVDGAKGGQRIWKKIRKRNDFLDCRAYATAVALAIRQQDAEPPPKSDARMSNLLNDPFLRRLV